MNDTETNIVRDLWIFHASAPACRILRSHRISECGICSESYSGREVLASLQVAGVKAGITPRVLYRREVDARLGVVPPRTRPIAPPTVNNSEPTCSLAPVSPPWQWTWARGSSFVPFWEMDPGPPEYWPGWVSWRRRRISR